MIYFTEKRVEELEPGEVFYLSTSPGHTPWRALNFRGTSQAWISHRDQVVPVQEVGTEDWGHIDYHWADAIVYVERPERPDRPDRRQEDIGRWLEMRARDIPLGAEYVAFGAKPDPKHTTFTCSGRDFAHMREGATRWVRLPDRRSN